MRIPRWIGIISLVVFATLFLAACEEGRGDDVLESDSAISSDSLQRYQQTQPVPVFDWSQLRQNLIELNTAQANTTVSTSFFFNLGVINPIHFCPSIGFAIPSTAQLTSPDQPYRFNGNDEGGTTVAQVEQTGIYTGDSTGTYVMCLTEAGNVYAFYWEGNVSTVTGAAQWRADLGQIVLLGEPTFDFSGSR